MASTRALVAAFALAAAAAAPAQQPTPPADFRPFPDGMHWIVRQPLTYVIGVSLDSVTVPAGFVADFARIPQVLQPIIRGYRPYIELAIVHDYLYWKQACTREQADRILLLGMIENQVREVNRVAIHNAARIAGGFAWVENARDRADGFVRILPADRQRVPANTAWIDYRQTLKSEGVAEGPDTPVAAAFCARADLPIEQALTTR